MDRSGATRRDGGGVGVHVGVNASVDSDGVLHQASRAAVSHGQANCADSVGCSLIGAVLTALFHAPVCSLHLVACDLHRRLDCFALGPCCFSIPLFH